MVFNVSMSQWICNNFSYLEIIAARKNDECYQLNYHDWGKMFGSVMYTQTTYNSNTDFLAYYMFVNSAVLQNSGILLIIRN